MDKTLLKIQQKNIPVNWRVERFGDVFDFLSTATYSRDILKESGEVQYLHYGDIHTKYNFHLDFTKNNLPFITEIERRNYPYMKNGDLVLADASEDYDGVGKGVEIKNIGDSKAISGLHTFLLRDKDSNFVLGYKGFIPSCDIVREQFYRFATGTKVYSLSKESLSKVKVLIPPKEEQKAIADCLSTWDDAIEKQTKLIAAKQQRKKALMQQLLSGKKRLPGFTEDWKEVRLCDICDLIHGYQFRDHDFSKEQTNYAVVKINNIQNGYFRNTELSFITEKRFLELSRFQLFEDDILMSLTGNIGRVVLLPKFDNVLIQNYRVGKFVEKNGVLKKYLKNILSSEQLFNQFNNLSNQSAQANFGKQDMDKLKISIPRNISEQNAVADILENSAAEIELEKKKLLILKRQKKGMMQNLLSGKVRLV